MGSRTLCIHILEILKKYASPDKPITQVKVHEYLKSEYGDGIALRSLMRYFDDLEAEHRVERNTKGYWVKGRFKEIEISVVLETVFEGLQMDSKNKKAIMEKLMLLSGNPYSRNYSRYRHSDTGMGTMSDDTLKYWEIVDEAIKSNCMIEIATGSYHEDKTMHLKDVYTVSPYRIINDKDHSYLICYSGRYGKDLEPRRLDKIMRMRIRKDLMRVPMESLSDGKDFRFDEYKKTRAYMFSGKPEPIRIRINRDRIHDFIDWYGKDYSIVDKRPGYPDVEIRFSSNAKSFFFWSLQYGHAIEVMSPEHLREELRNHYENQIKKYGDVCISGISV